MIYSKWDGASEIDGRTAAYIIGNNPAYGAQDVYILRGDDGSLYDILPIGAIRAGNPDGTDDEAVAAYIAAITAPAEGNPDELTSLRAEVAELRAALDLLLEGATE